MSGRLATFLSSSAVVGATAIIALVLSVGQLVWPRLIDLLSSYSIEVDRPDLVNFFCEGSEGIDANPDQRPICDGSNHVIFLATPLFYLNASTGDRSVWLRRETVVIKFMNRSGRSVKEVTLAAERVASTDRWHAPGGEQIDPGKAISHSTLFYPSVLGCHTDVDPKACLTGNGFEWRDFADQIIAREITHADFTFQADLKAGDRSIVAKSLPCQWKFDDAHIATLKAWRDAIDEEKKGHPQVAYPNTLTPPYASISANCVPVQTQP